MVCTFLLSKLFSRPTTSVRFGYLQTLAGLTCHLLQTSFQTCSSAQLLKLKLFKPSVFQRSPPAMISSHRQMKKCPPLPIGKIPTLLHYCPQQSVSKKSWDMTLQGFSRTTLCYISVTISRRSRGATQDMISLRNGFAVWFLRISVPNMWV